MKMNYKNEKLKQKKEKKKYRARYAEPLLVAAKEGRQKPKCSIYIYI